MENDGKAEAVLTLGENFKQPAEDKTMATGIKLELTPSISHMSPKSITHTVMKIAVEAILTRTVISNDEMVVRSVSSTHNVNAPVLIA